MPVGSYTMKQYYAISCTRITVEYQKKCRDGEKVPEGYWAVMDLLNVNREMNQGEG